MQDSPEIVAVMYVMYTLTADTHTINKPTYSSSLFKLTPSLQYNKEGALTSKDQQLGSRENLDQKSSELQICSFLGIILL